MSTINRTQPEPSPAMKMGSFIFIGLIFLVLVIFLISAISNAGKSEKHTEAVNDALRKCTIMEAADIHATGIGKKSNNVFNDAKVTCNNFMWDWGDDEFIETVTTDWSTRKNETIEGRSLTYYLDTLGW